MLGIDQRQQALDDRQLVASDLPGDDLLAAGFAVEAPLVAILYEGDGTGPASRADLDRRLVAVDDDLVVRVPGREEFLARALLVLGPAEDEVAPYCDAGYPFRVDTTPAPM